MKKNQRLSLLFLAVGFLACLEFIFVRGMFTWLIAVFATILVGGLNILQQLKLKDWNQVGLYTLCIVAICMGYFAFL